MDVRGQRFTFDLAENNQDETSTSTHIPRPLTTSPFDFLQDIHERPVKPPTSPKLRPTTSGFPEHRKRTRRSPAKQQRGGSAAEPSPTHSQNASGVRATRAPHSDAKFEADQRKQIGEENRQLLASMTEAEVAEERQELLSRLDPSLVQRLLKRANLDEGRGDTGIASGTPNPVESKRREEDDIDRPHARLSAEPETDDATHVPIPTGRSVQAEKAVRFDDDPNPRNPVDISRSPHPPSLIPPSIHFAAAPSTADLDPSSPDFLTSLHQKYFPNLPSDPSKLAWMAPIPTHGSPADLDSPYYPNQTSISPSALRFNFRGALVPPRIARAVPISKGLHHHGEAPEAAGYTVPELSRLARSALPSQRCLAFQTLGRVLYRLGRREWGDDEGVISDGLWRCMDEEKVLGKLEEAANGEGGHQGSRAYAVEALWLWQKGGGRRWIAK